MQWWNFLNPFYTWLYNVGIGQRPGSSIFIVCLSLLLSVVISVVSRLVMDVPKLDRYQKEISTWNKAKAEAQRTANKRLYRKVKRKEKYIQKIQSKVMMERFKPMFIYMPGFFALFWILNGFFNGYLPLVAGETARYVVILPFSFPIGFFGQNIGAENLFGMSFVWWYAMTSFAFGAIIQRIFGLNIGMGGMSAFQTR
ncbi:MAG: EMC3/TMCO1 family protein [Promethearchaeota archaeon]